MYPAAPARGGLLLHQQQQGGLQPRRSRGRSGTSRRTRATGGTARPASRSSRCSTNLITHESQIRTRPHVWQHDPAKVPVPAYHPDTPEVRQDWAQYYDNITTMDGWRRAEAEGAGRRRPGGRHDRLLLRRPRLRHAAEQALALQLRAARAADRLHPAEVQAPRCRRTTRPAARSTGWWASSTSRRRCSAWPGSQAAGVDAGPRLHGPVRRWPPQPFLYGFRGRMDERYDLVRSVRDGRYVYVRNYMPHLIYGQYLDYMFQTPTTRVWKQLYDAGKLKPPQTYFWETQAAEELYDLQNDPDEVKNLAGVAGPSGDPQAVAEGRARLAAAGAGCRVSAGRRDAHPFGVLQPVRGRARPLEEPARTGSSRRPNWPWRTRAEALPKLKEALQDRDTRGALLGRDGHPHVGEKGRGRRENRS